jgi:hypothetical protein
MGVTMVMEALMDTIGETMVQGVPMGTMETMQRETTTIFLHKLVLEPQVESFLGRFYLSSREINKQGIKGNKVRVRPLMIIGESIRLWVRISRSHVSTGLLQYQVQEQAKGGQQRSTKH